MNMAVQMNYGEPSRGIPGLLYDRANYEAVTRRNGADDGKMFFGLGVVQGAEPGKDITLPATGATVDKFEGVVMYSANTEMDDDGAVLLHKGQILDVCQSGKLWVQLTPTKGTNLAVKARFIGAEQNGIAPAQFVEQL